jgi:hypothetical protein
MTCEEEFNALRRAERELAAWWQHQSDAADSPVPAPVVASAGEASGSTAAEGEAVQRLAELTAAVNEKRRAYNRCRGRAEEHATFESLMRDASGAPLGGGAGPPM